MLNTTDQITKHRRPLLEGPADYLGRRGECFPLMRNCITRSPSPALLLKLTSLTRRFGNVELARHRMFQQLEMTLRGIPVFLGEDDSGALHFRFR